MKSIKELTKVFNEMDEEDTFDMYKDKIASELRNGLTGGYDPSWDLVDATVDGFDITELGTALRDRMLSEIAMPVEDGYSNYIQMEALISKSLFDEDELDIVIFDLKENIGISNTDLKAFKKGDEITLLVDYEISVEPEEDEEQDEDLDESMNEISDELVDRVHTERCRNVNIASDKFRRVDDAHTGELMSVYKNYTQNDIAKGKADAEIKYINDKYKDIEKQASLDAGIARDKLERNNKLMAKRKHEELDINDDGDTDLSLYIVNDSYMYNKYCRKAAERMAKGEKVDWNMIAKIGADRYEKDVPDERISKEEIKVTADILKDYYTRNPLTESKFDDKVKEINNYLKPLGYEVASVAYGKQPGYKGINYRPIGASYTEYVDGKDWNEAITNLKLKLAKNESKISSLSKEYDTLLENKPSIKDFLLGKLTEEEREFSEEDWEELTDKIADGVEGSIRVEVDENSDYVIVWYDIDDDLHNTYDHDELIKDLRKLDYIDEITDMADGLLVVYVGADPDTTEESLKAVIAELNKVRPIINKYWKE